MGQAALSVSIRRDGGPGVLRRAPDAFVVLAVLVVVLLGVPSELIVAPLGAAGTPAQILGIGLLVLWLVSRLARREGVEGIGPVKWLLLALVVAVLLSYIRGVGQPLSMAEKNSADRAMLTLAAWSGIALAVADGFESRARLDRLLRLVSVGVVAIAVLGMIQFFFGIDIAHLFSIPGLSTNHAFGSLVQRSDFRRVSGTTLHPIEFGVVLSMVLPLIIHYAIQAGRGTRWWWWCSAALVAFALPMSVARTAMLGGVVALSIAFWSWPRGVKARVALLIPPGLVAMSVAVPGLLGTIRGLFVNASTDPSTIGRLEDYDAVWYYFTQAPVTGRGIGTFIPSIYRTLDNQYLGTLVETGLVGLLALLALLVGGVLTAGVIRERSTDGPERSLAVALAAGISVPTISFVTFDGLAFPMCAGLTFLLLGAVAALWRIDLRQRVPAGAVVERPARVWVPRTAAAGVVLLAVLVPYVAWVSAGASRYEAYTTVLIDPPRDAGGNLYLGVGSADKAASILQSDLVGPAVRADLDARFPQGRYGVSVGYGSLERDSDVIATSSQLRMRSVSPTLGGARALRTALLDTAAAELRRLQLQAGVVDPKLTLVMRTLSQPGVQQTHGSEPRMLAGVALLVLVVIGAAAGATSRSSPGNPPVRGVRRDPGLQVDRARPASGPPAEATGSLGPPT